MRDFNNSDQLKSFLKKESSRLKISVNNCYRTFIARAFLERISTYNHDEILIKGSSAETAYLGSLVRAMTDVDIATIYTHKEGMHVVVDALTDKKNDPFSFEFSKPIEKTPTGIYKLHLYGKFGTIEQPLSIDLQENYNRLIEPQKRIMPKIFEEDREFEIFVPSFEEFLAEKLCIILESNKEDVLNTRVKDFYDVYELHGGKYDHDKLEEYFGKIMQLRNKIKIEDAKTSMLDENYVLSHQSIWDNTKKSYDFVDTNIDFVGAVYYTRAVLRQFLQANGQQMEDLFAFQKVKK